MKLRQLVDERYTVSSLLGLSRTSTDKAGESIKLLSSSGICSNVYENVLSENMWMKESSTNASTNTELSPEYSNKRVRRSGKYTPQERERIR